MLPAAFPDGTVRAVQDLVVTGLVEPRTTQTSLPFRLVQTYSPLITPFFGHAAPGLGLACSAAITDVGARSITAAAKANPEITRM